jgi:hypothetical protein
MATARACKEGEPSSPEAGVEEIIRQQWQWRRAK